MLQPNFRGSTGYGKKFLNAGNKQWGDKMQDDLTWGVKYLVAQGIVDPKRVGIMGGSYGGYATLAGVAFTPDLYAAAVAIVAPSNLITLLETIPPYWESGRMIFHTRMGDPTTPEGKKQLERQSPLNSADKIKTPLLVVQGANDPRVKKAESEQIVIALRDRGFPVEYIVAPDEGHGFRAAGEQHGDDRGGRGVPRQASGRPLPGRRHAGGGGAPEGDHGRSEDRRPGEEGGPGHRRPPKPSVDRRPAPRSTRPDVNAGGQTIPMAVTPMTSRSTATSCDRGRRPDGRCQRHHDAPEGHAPAAQASSSRAPSRST